MVALGYLVVLGLFAGLIVFCFIWGAWEYKKPSDPGPLFIDLDRTIDERSEALTLRSSVKAILENKSEPFKEETKLKWLTPSKVLTKASEVDGKIKKILSVDDDLSIPEGAKIDSVLVVNGNLKTGNNCTLDEDVYVVEGAIIGAGNRLQAITTQGDLTIGGGTTVKRFVDADGELKIGDGSSILGSATSAMMITAGRNCTLKKIYSPAGYRLGKARASRQNLKKASKDAKPSELIKWNPKMDRIITERFGEASINNLSMEIKDCLGVQVPENVILRRARILGLVKKSLTKLNRGQKPKYLESATVWMQEAETIRVRGDVRVPKGEAIPYSMIVEGNLSSQNDVIFQGGLHIKGRAIIGARNRIEKSIVCQKELFLSEDVIVNNCIDCEGPVFIRKGARVGVGVEGGGIASASTIFLEEAEGALKIYSRKEIRIVESLNEVTPEYLKPTVEGCAA